MARDGAFEGIDAVVMLHPFSYDVAIQPFLGRRQVRATYHGVAAHASAQPFMGRNALDAVVAGYTGIAMLRQHTTPSDRVHGIVVDGGQRPNVVPATASAEYYVPLGRTGHARRPVLPRGPRPAGRRGDDGNRGRARVGPAAGLPADPRQPGTGGPVDDPPDRRGRTALPPGVVPETLSGPPTSATSACASPRSTHARDLLPRPLPAHRGVRRGRGVPTGDRGSSTAPSGWRSRPSTSWRTRNCSPPCGPSSRARAGCWTSRSSCGERDGRDHADRPVLGGVERVGNRIPEPFVLFVGLFVALAVASTAMALTSTTVRLPGRTRRRRSAGSSPGGSAGSPRRSWTTSRRSRRWGRSSSSSSRSASPSAAAHVGAHPAGVLRGPAVGAALPRAAVCMVGHVMADSVMIVIPPLAAMVFKAAGRHPVAGLSGRSPPRAATRRRSS